MAKPQSTSHRAKKRKIRDEFVYDTIMSMVNENPEKSIRPEDIAMLIRKEEWQSLLKRIRLFNRKLAVAGYLHIIRKGQIADPDDFKGVYKVRAAEAASSYVPRMPKEA